ncbi:hypothetical protein BV455_00990 [Parageobacillus caldoxylosilyticus]|uniref:Uncharacterized protein n=1 Tax=Parageobacillus caldoxylosilyticus NBRC 107762 TaxID=1220594 RepID=A0A023DIK7_9BACL|nr:hypothetical protein [Parageobacillus caldoxylosilyticus]QXJ37727.1 hypothetical protein BV455_00990 [Parageobacillus caldoxylosilyticus]BDG42368.1 hypothetical protein PcaKH35_07130 [Parageobacillus caldoxylosilyticus]GAJ41068.1 hypothetical protein GCA01S_057_00070 [Parageobacillus caldoxylosilyticus NBRC 107762]
MRKKSTYCDAFRELVAGANKRLAIWNGLSSIRLNRKVVGLDVCLTLSRRHVQAHMGKVIARNVQ